MLRSLFSLPHPDSLTTRWWIKTLAINGAALLVLFGVLQLVPVGGHNPPVVREPVWDSDETRALAVHACFDCHSNETEWPWYARIAPASWVLAYDVTEGREALNFSEWDRHAVSDIDPDDPFPPKTLLERIEEEIRSNRMPPGLYRLGNPEARLTPDEKDALVEGLLRTVEQNQAPREEP